MNSSDELIYGLNDKPPFIQSIFVALQHLLAIFVPIITPTLVISGALGLSIQTTSYLISMALFVSGIATLIQVKKIGPVGSGLLSIQGTSFAFLGPILAAGFAAGRGEQSLGLIFGICLFGSFIEMILSQFIRKARRFITPLVTGIVVTLIGLSLIKVGITDMAGGFGAKDFGSLKNLGLSFFVLFTIIILNRSRNKHIRMSSIVIGLLAGYIVSVCMGIIDFSGLKELSIATVPIPFKFGFKFSFSMFIPIALIYLITTIESTGDLTATSMVSNEPIEGETYIKRIKGGVLGDGVNSFIASIFNTFPNTTFSQNNGVIQLTGVASRYIGIFIAVFLVILGIFPVVGGVLTLMPKPVLGGATMIMFGTVAAAGIKIIATQKLDRRAIMILALSFSLGLGVQAVPEVLKHMPDVIKNVFGSPITTGGLTALIANILLPEQINR